ncbi:MAG: hypothetical protein HOI34_13255 [Rhodospirillaceae bacterium]|nr:hypothetical protein [Rhodospirillaceae bacterium]
MNLRFPNHALAFYLLASFALEACSTAEDLTDMGFDDPSPDTSSPAETEDAGLPEQAADAIFPNAASRSRSLSEVLVEVGEQSPAYLFDALRIPAGSWDGYVQASNGSFLQCLIAWGPREARLGISTGWHGRLFIQFRAPDWPPELIAGGSDLVVSIDHAIERTVLLEGNDEILWINLGTDLMFAQSLAEGNELTLAAGNHVMVYPLDDSDIAIPALYECAGLQTQEGGDGGLSIYGLQTRGHGEVELTEAVVRVLLESGFGDVVLRDSAATADLYGSRAIFSGGAWGGEAELFASVFGFNNDTKKALVEIADDAAHLCREDIHARLLRMEVPTPAGLFGKSSVLCSGETGEFVLETLAFFDGTNILVIHAIVDDVSERERIDDNYDRVIGQIVGQS